MISEIDLLPLVRSPDRGTQLRALKALKNSVIGHTEQKEWYLERGVLDDLLAILSAEDGVKDQYSEELMIEAGIVLGSFAYSGPDISAMLYGPETISTLVLTLKPTSPPKLLLASLRTLTTLWTAQPPTQSLSTAYPTLAPSLAALLSHFYSSAASEKGAISYTIITQVCGLLFVLAPAHSTGQSVLSDHLAISLCDLVDKLLTKPNMIASLSVSSNAGATGLAERKMLSSAILALSHLMSPQAARHLASSAPYFMDLLVKLLRAQEPTIRLAACALITTLYTTPLSGSGDVITGKPAAQNTELAMLLVPALMKLLDDALSVDDGRGCDPLVLHTFAVVCREGGEVADRCVEVGIIKKVVRIIAHVAPSTHSATQIGKTESKLLSGGLFCLSALGLHKEEYRKAIIDANALTIVVAVMNTENAPAVREIKIAACNVLRSLSRSVLLLRTSLVESGIVGGVVELLGDVAVVQESESASATAAGSAKGEVLYDESMSEVEKTSARQKYLSAVGGAGQEADGVIMEEDDDESEDGESLEVRTAAMAAVCNLVLEFSPLRKPILDQGILPLIVAGARSRYTPLRLNSVWALKHMVYGDDMQTRGLVLEEVGFPLLMKLCNDPEMQVQEQALDFIRNLIARSDDYIDKLFANVGVHDLFELLDGKLAMRSRQSDDSESDEDEDFVEEDEGGKVIFTTKPYYTEIIIATAYILVHIAAGYEHHRQTIIQHESVVKKVIALMAHEREEVRLACLWIVLNLTWVEEPPRGAAGEDLMMEGVVDDDAEGSSSAGAGGESASQSPGNYVEVCRKRAAVLVRLGVRAKLAMLKQDRVLDVREKTKTAIYQIDSLTGAFTDGYGDRREESQQAQQVQQGGDAMEVDNVPVVRHAYMYMNPTAVASEPSS
ncbi:armadillo-type protein [Myxozyma melibiosi]|uniref:Armadillo-type protein n=1 Tax=Myxozyma melibiosi TaxID=54550 RepID=A0ABR1FCB0_9ASCO